MSPARRAVRRPRSGPHAPGLGGAARAGCAILTVSDTRGRAEDVSGARAAALLEAVGHAVIARAWVRDEVPAIRREVRAALRDPAVDVVVLTGGTGIAERDVTPEALSGVIEKPLAGFGELFRMRSLEQVGTAAWLSRAGAGVARGRLVVFLPGSPAAVELALGQILIPELTHVLRMLGRIPTGD